MNNPPGFYLIGPIYPARIGPFFPTLTMYLYTVGLDSPQMRASPVTVMVPFVYDG